MISNTNRLTSPLTPKIQHSHSSALPLCQGSCGRPAELRQGHPWGSALSLRWQRWQRWQCRAWKKESQNMAEFTFPSTQWFLCSILKYTKYMYIWIYELYMSITSHWYFAVPSRKLCLILRWLKGRNAGTLECRTQQNYIGRWHLDPCKSWCP